VGIEVADLVELAGIQKPMSSCTATLSHDRNNKVAGTALPVI
jgi:hypothetical protein